MKKKRVLIALLLGAILTTGGCGKKKEQVEVTPTPDLSYLYGTEAPEATSNGEEVATDGAIEGTGVVDETKEAKETDAPKKDGIFIYYGDDNAEYIVSEQIEKQKITPELLIHELAKHDILPENTKVNKCKLTKSKEKGTSLSVDFSQEFQDALFSQGTAGEFIMMGSVVDTFLEAYGASTIYITVNGESLESGHCIYENAMTYYEPNQNVSSEEAMEQISEALGVE